MIVKIMDGLYVGDKDSEHDAVARRGVTHVLRVGPFADAPPDVPGAAAVAVMVVDIDDVEGANLLDRLPAAVDFIDAAFSLFRAGQSGGVLVHCVAGQSR